jgi:flagellar protein FliO/FliZ
VETVGLVVRIGISLIAVLGLMWLLARMARKPLGKRASRAVGVLGRAQLSRHASVAVVKVGDRAFVVGVTDSRVSLLGETDPEVLDPPVAGPLSTRTAVDVPAGVPVEPGDTPYVRPARTTGPLSGSALSPKVWGQALDVLRERTVRRP